MQPDQAPPHAVDLRDATEMDLPIFFEQQREPQGNRMASFPARDQAAFLSHWKTNVLGDEAVIKKAVLFEGDVAGNIVCYERAGLWLVGYWLGRRFWGQGIATRALARFLQQVSVRPLHAYVALDNVASIRVLEKCGFARRAAPAAGPDSVEELLFERAT
jgi:RimJ/RimL family protein N-acetyltransferase